MQLELRQILKSSNFMCVRRAFEDFVDAEAEGLFGMDEYQDKQSVLMQLDDVYTESQAIDIMQRYMNMSDYKYKEEMLESRIIAINDAVVSSLVNYLFHSSQTLYLLFNDMSFYKDENIFADSLHELPIFWDKYSVSCEKLNNLANHLTDMFMQYPIMHMNNEWYTDEQMKEVKEL